MTKADKSKQLDPKDAPHDSYNKAELILELTKNEKINIKVLDELARNLKQPSPKGKGFNLYSKMNDELLGVINRIFVKKESDGRGLFLEYRTANFITQKSKVRIDRIEIRHRFSNGDEIDVTGFNSKGKPIVIAECKDKRAKKEDIAKWIKNSKQLFQDYNGSLDESYFVTSDKVTSQNYTYIEDFKDINSDDGVLRIHGLIRGIIKNLGDEKSLTKSRGISMSIYEVRQNQFEKVFPRKKED